MPWYISTARMAMCATYTTFGLVQCKWVWDAEDRYRRSATWQPTVGTIVDHTLSLRKLGASLIRYEFQVDGKTYYGERFKSGGIGNEEMLPNPTLLGVGTELVVYYDPLDPGNGSAVKIQADRSAEAFFFVGILLSATIAYRSLRAETVVPNMYFRLFGTNRRLNAQTGIKARRQHVREKMKYGKDTGAV